MKKVIFFFSLAVFTCSFYACQDEISDKETLSFHEDGDFKSNHSRNCSSYKVLAQKLKDNPGLAKKLENIEKHTQRAINAKPGNGNGNGGGNGGGPGGGGGGGGDPTPYNGTVQIPVYVHVIYSNANENISEAQINSQIAVLNEDFTATNGDVGQVPAEFAGLVADSEIEFTLAGVTRKSSTRTSWGTNDAMKFASNGGVDVVTPGTHMNIWVCNIGGGILGYAQFPGDDPATDGIVVSPQYFGTTGFVSAPFDQGRTTTHEVGHYLNLRHIWGDGRCNRDDFVSDTPTSDRPNYGCPSYPTVHCRTTDMTMNYMDYVDDACMYMFSEGQKDRMRALFATGGARESIVL